MKKGFTLIELLAVIVILAIIAVIAVPIVLGIINDAKAETDKRSIELYAKAIQNEIAKEQLDGEAIQSGDLDSSFLNSIKYDGDRVVCETNKVYSDGTVYLSGCTVGGKVVNYTYGIEKSSSEESDENNSSALLYYTRDLAGTIDETDAPTSPGPKPNDKDVYLGYKVSNGKISEVYVCFVRNSNEYCLKGNDTNALEDNETILRTAFNDIVSTEACNFSGRPTGCRSEDFFVGFDNTGKVEAFSFISELWCGIEDGEFSCE